MPQLPRDRPHLYLRGNGRPENYTTRQRGGGSPLPQLDRATHAEFLRTALTAALAAADVRRTERNPALTSAAPGFYLDFELSLGSENAAESLENRPKHIELVSVRQESDATPALATVFVPDTAADHFLSKVVAYESKNTETDRPQFQDLIARIESIAPATVRSIYTDDREFPARVRDCESG